MASTSASYTVQKAQSKPTQQAAFELVHVGLMGLLFAFSAVLRVSVVSLTSVLVWVDGLRGVETTGLPALPQANGKPITDSVAPVTNEPSPSPATIPIPEVEINVSQVPEEYESDSHVSYSRWQSDSPIPPVRDAPQLELLTTGAVTMNEDDLLTPTNKTVQNEANILPLNIQTLRALSDAEDDKDKDSEPASSSIRRSFSTAVTIADEDDEDRAISPITLGDSLPEVTEQESIAAPSPDAIEYVTQSSSLSQAELIQAISPTTPENAPPPYALPSDDETKAAKASVIVQKVPPAPAVVPEVSASKAHEEEQPQPSSVLEADKFDWSEEPLSDDGEIPVLIPSTEPAVVESPLSPESSTAPQVFPVPGSGDTAADDSDNEAFVYPGAQLPPPPADSPPPQDRPLPSHEDSEVPAKTNLQVDTNITEQPHQVVSPVQSTFGGRPDSIISTLETPTTTISSTNATIATAMSPTLVSNRPRLENEEDESASEFGDVDVSGVNGAGADNAGRRRRRKKKTKKTKSVVFSDEDPMVLGDSSPAWSADEDNVSIRSASPMPPLNSSPMIRRGSSGFEKHLLSRTLPVRANSGSSVPAVPSPLARNTTLPGLRPEHFNHELKRAEQIQVLSPPSSASPRGPLPAYEHPPPFSTRAASPAPSLGSLSGSDIGDGKKDFSARQVDAYARWYQAMNKHQPVPNIPKLKNEMGGLLQDELTRRIKLGGSAPPTRLTPVLLGGGNLADRGRKGRFRSRNSSIGSVGSTGGN